MRARLSVNAAAWRTLTDTQRAGWASLGQSMTRTDSLGTTYTFTGFMAFCSVNNNLAAAGDSTISAAPAISTPVQLSTTTITLTAAAVSVTYAATPLGAGARIFAYASHPVSPGKIFNKNFRLVQVSAAAAASPLVLSTAYIARFGAPVVGQRVFFSFRTYAAGFLSGPKDVSQVVA